MRIFGDATEGTLVDGDADQWFGDFLDVRCRLVHTPEDLARPVDPGYAKKGDRVGFADGFPLLLLSEASLADLNGRLSEPVPFDRFRPNLLVAGVGAYAEDGWCRIRVQKATFRVVKPCGRCSVVAVDQAMGIRGPEPLRTLSRYRPRSEGGAVLFGQNLVHEVLGTLRVGDRVETVPTP